MLTRDISESEREDHDIVHFDLEPGGPLDSELWPVIWMARRQGAQSA